MRTEFTSRNNLSGLEEDVTSLLPEDAVVTMPKPEPKKIVVLATREGHCLGDLLLRHNSGELKADIRAVTANHPDLEKLVSRFNIPWHCIPHGNLTREDHEDRILKTLERYEPDYIVLARYMRVLSRDFVSRYSSRIINIHHSFLPAFAGSRPYRQAFERGVKIIGATAHFVTEDLDDGPIISQSVTPVDHSHGEEEMKQAGRDIEKIVLARALRLVFEDRVFVHGGRTVIFE
jgi:formyltetrahydrofolate deformylase